MGDAGRKIIEGLKQALAGDFSRVTIEGQTWVRQRKGPSGPRQTRMPTKKEREAAQRMTQPYRQQISATPALLSILYDIDLLPEQIVLPVNAVRMSAFCEVFKRMTAEQIASLFEPAAPVPPQDSGR